MLQFDNNDEEKIIIILATTRNLDILEESVSWYIDGTLNTCPQLFHLILTTHAEIPNPNGTSWVFPCAYTILTQKDTPTYTESFDALVALTKFAPETIMVDNELALRNTLGASFPSVSVDGCFFHFCQGVVKNVNRLGYKEDYERTTTDPSTGRKSNIPFRIWVRRLMMLAFVPAGEVRDSFYSSWMRCPMTSTSMTSLATFRLFGSRDCLPDGELPGTANAKFPPPTWNCFDSTLIC